MKTVLCALVALGLSSTAMAQNADPGPLPPGKPAGVKQARINEVPWLLGAVALSLGFGVLVFANSSSTAVATNGTTS